MTKRLIVAIVLLAVVAGGLVGFNLFRDRMIEQALANRAAAPIPVETITTEAIAWKPMISAIGTINAAQGVELTVESAGILREIGFEANADVEAGQVLLRLDDEVQKADLAAARSRLELDRTTLARERELQSRGVASESRFDQALAAYSSAEAQLARAEAVIAQRRLIAPFDGTIGLPRVDPGAYVSPGTIIATLQDLDRMRVDFSLPEQTLPSLFIGQGLQARIDGEARAFNGEITGIDPRVDPGSRMVAVRGRIDNPERALTPGQFTRLQIDLPVEDGVIAVPQSAVTISLYGDFVYVVRPREKDPDMLEARQVFVTPGRRSNGDIEIVRGLDVGERIIVSGQNRLSNRAPVTLAETRAPVAGP